MNWCDASLAKRSMIPPAPRLKPGVLQSLSKRLWAAASAAASAATVAAAAWAGSAPALALDVKASSVKLASAYDPQTFDPHALALLYHTRITHQIYESLVTRDAQYRIEPSLAVSWTNPSPTVWRFQLRAGVTFHDGSPFTADDAAFSIERALGPNSRRSFQLDGVKAARRIDPLTVDVQLAAPDAVFPEKLWLIGMMSKRWSEQYGVTAAQDFGAKQETHAARHANGTGPFKLLRYEPDVRTVLVRHEAWWGWKEARHGNVRRVEFTTIRSDATRVAALVSGEVDLVFDPPFQDIARLERDARLKVMRSPDIGQQYLVFDQARDELPGSDIKGRNPFKDRRVRQAVAHAINLQALSDKVMRGYAQPSGALLSSMVEGSLPELNRPYAHDPEKARALLAQAGYPQGFSVAMSCVNISWREAVCQAVAAMLSQVGIRAALRTEPTSTFFPKLTAGQVSLAEFGWSPTPDAYFSLNALLHSYGPGGAGNFNAGRYRNPELDQLIEAVRNEVDLTRRRALVTTALRLATDDLPMLPLFRRTVTWVMVKPVSAVQWPSDLADLRFLRIQAP